MRPRPDETRQSGKQAERLPLFETKDIFQSSLVYPNADQDSELWRDRLKGMSHDLSVAHFVYKYWPVSY